MEIEIKNCNNIDFGKISIVEGNLNIKYAMNGTGKSTIARAIELFLKGNDAINELRPFKFINSTNENEKPIIAGLNNTHTAALFNDSYINQYAFKQDEIIANSFEIFVKTADFDLRMQKIENLIAEIKDTFKKSEEIDRVIGDLGTLSDSFGKSKSGYSEAGILAKGIGKGNKIANIPKGLESYSAYLKSSLNSKWLKWQMDGNTYLEISDNCPYCTAPTENKKDTISLISKEYDAKSIEHLNKIVGVLESLRKYFSENANSKINKLTTNINGFSKEEKNYLKEIKDQVDTLKSKMLDIRGLTYFSIKDVNQISEHFSKLKIDLGFLSELNSENTSLIVDNINKSLDKVLDQVGLLQGEVNQQNALIKRTIEENRSEINEFLKNAGYKYYVDIEYDNEKYKMKLRHFDFDGIIESGAKHLSYGERNAFSLVLFMYECLAKKPSIIILDDPISSFDRNKKYAVIDMLFRSKKCFRGKTLLMMTHDLEPIVDIVYTLHRNFTPLPAASFIECKNGVIHEEPITRKEILTFAQICDENIVGQQEDVVKLVYLRRYYEILNNKGLAYELLSNLLHKRVTPVIFNGELTVNMTEDEISRATQEIKQKLPTFEYAPLLKKLSDQVYMKDAYQSAKNNYEKLQLFRVLHERIPENDVLNKFINETYHIENEYVMQINPCKYNIVPTFIIKECDNIVFAKDGTQP